jgi:Flp pilus assembly protein TadB
LKVLQYNINLMALCIAYHVAYWYAIAVWESAVAVAVAVAVNKLQQKQRQQQQLQQQKQKQQCTSSSSGISVAAGSGNLAYNKTVWGGAWHGTGRSGVQYISG